MTQHPALEFLMNLDPAEHATFNVEHYTDRPKGEEKPEYDPLGDRYANLTRANVEALLPVLHAINNQGAGIFVARNQCTGHRNEANVSRIRGIHADMDGITEVQLASVTAVLQPTIVVQSSGPGRYQLYWQLAEGETLTKAETKAINQCLVKRYGADKGAVDVSRLLRLPGFKHMKYREAGKTPTVTATVYGHTLTADQIRQAFPPSQTYGPAGKQSINIQTAATIPHSLTHQLSTLASSIASAHPHLWAGDWQNTVRPSGEIGYPSRLNSTPNFRFP